MTRYRRERIAARWWAPLRVDAPEGIEETQQHPHLLIRSMTLGESIALDRDLADQEDYVRALEASKAGADVPVPPRPNSSALLDLLDMVLVGHGGDWAHYAGWVPVNTTSQGEILRSLDPADLAPLLALARSGQAPTEAEKEV